MNIKRINESFSRMGELGLFGKKAPILKENWSRDDIEKMKEMLASGDMDNIKLVEQMTSPFLFRDLVDSVYGILLMEAEIVGQDIEAIQKLFSLRRMTILVKLSTLPETIGNLSKLERLSAHYNNLSSIPESIGKLSNLVFLDLHDNNLNTLPESIANLSGLEWLDLRDNNFSEAEKERIQRMLPNCKIYFEPTSQQ